MGRKATVPIIVTIVDERDLNGDMIAIINRQVASCCASAIDAREGEFTRPTNPEVKGDQTLNCSIERSDVCAGIPSNITAEDGFND